MLVSFRNTEVYFNTDDVVSVDKDEPDRVEIVYCTGRSEKLSAAEFNNDPDFVSKLLDAFATAPGFFRRGNDNSCLNVRRAKRVWFSKEEAVVFLHAGNPKRYTEQQDIQAISTAVGGDFSLAPR